MIGGQRLFQMEGLLLPVGGAAAILLLLWLLPVNKQPILKRWLSPRLLLTALSSLLVLYCAQKMAMCCRSIRWISLKWSLVALLAAIYCYRKISSPLVVMLRCATKTITICCAMSEVLMVLLSMDNRLKKG